MVCFLFFHWSKCYAACIIIARFLSGAVVVVVGVCVCARARVHVYACVCCVRTDLKKKKQKQERYTNIVLPLNLSNTTQSSCIHFLSVVFHDFRPDHGRDVLYDRKSSPPSSHYHRHRFIYVTVLCVCRLGCNVYYCKLCAIQSGQPRSCDISFLSWYNTRW